MSRRLLEGEGIMRRLGGRRVLDGIGLRIERGQGYVLSCWRACSPKE